MGNMRNTSQCTYARAYLYVCRPMYVCMYVYVLSEMPLMFGLPFPPNLLKTGVGPSVVQSCYSLSLLFGGGEENRKI